jgi:coatomer subunit beta'
MYLLGFIPQNNKVYLADKDMNVYVYSLSLNLIEYQTAILREDMETAASILPSIPKEQVNKVARFLEARGQSTLTHALPFRLSDTYPLVGHKRLALEVSQDQDHKFDLAISIDELQTALAITETVPQGEADPKWKMLGDRALALWQFDLARRCFENSNDLSSLMLLLLSMGDKQGLEQLVDRAGRESIRLISRLGSSLF